MPHTLQTYFALANPLEGAVAELLAEAQRSTRSAEACEPSAPSVYLGSHWGNGTPAPAQFNVLFDELAECEAIAHLVPDIERRVSAMLKRTDADGQLRDYRVAIILWYRGQPDLPPLYRRD